MNICERIKRKYIRLSKGQRKVAQFVVDNPTVVATQVAVEVGRLAGVSESTVIRFCYAMDLAGFSELQEKMKEYLEQTGTLLTSPSKASKQHTSKHVSMLGDVAAIKSLVEHIELEQLQQSAQLVEQAKHIHILCFNELTPTAVWLYHQLQQTKSNIHLHRYSDVLTNNHIIHVEEQALFVVFVEDAYIAEIQGMLNGAKDNGLKVIAIGQNEAQRALITADQFLAVQSSKGTCSAAIISLLEAMLKETQPAQQAVFV